MTAQSGATSVFQFNGQHVDGESGFVYLRARYYDPLTGQFVSHDPLCMATLDGSGFASSRDDTKKPRAKITIAGGSGGSAMSGSGNSSSPTCFFVLSGIRIPSDCEGGLYKEIMNAIKQVCGSGVSATASAISEVPGAGAAIAAAFAYHAGPSAQFTAAQRWGPTIQAGAFWVQQTCRLAGSSAR